MHFAAEILIELPLQSLTLISDHLGEHLHRSVLRSPSDCFPDSGLPSAGFDSPQSSVILAQKNLLPVVIPHR